VAPCIERSIVRSATCARAAGSQCRRMCAAEPARGCETAGQPPRLQPVSG
jgi:hypothetical protein